jgi:hypothetical protein
LNLKSRLAILEEKFFSENKSTLPVGLGKCSDPPSGNFQHTVVNKDTSFNAFHPCITSEMKARDNPLNYNNGYCIKSFNTQNKAELITAENIVKQGKPKEPETIMLRSREIG